MAVIPTENHGYKKQEKGDDDWHIALNDTLDILDVDVVLRDTLANRPAAGTSGRIFIATDTNELYHDDGTSWNKLLSLNHSDLNNLSADDHPQYLLENEVREVAKAESASRPDRKYFSDLDYSVTNSMPTGTVIYVKLFLIEGQQYSGISTYHTSSTFADRAVGIYSESNNKPGSLLATSGVQNVSISEGEFTQLNFQSTFTVPSTDEYFVAFLGNSSTNAFVTSSSVNANVPTTTNTPFVPVFSESSAVTDGLPAVASSSVFKSNLPFIALER